MGLWSVWSSHCQSASGVSSGGEVRRNVLVQATLMKYEERLPPRKVSESLDRTYGLRVSPATVLDIPDG